MNHDGTNGTVDLFSKNIVQGAGWYVGFNSSNASQPGLYAGSSLDDYLERVIYNKFADSVKNNLNLMNVESNGGIIQRHIVAPSLTELGSIPTYTDTSFYTRDGNIYPIFSPECEPNYKTVYKMPGGPNGYVGDRYWTRSRRNYNCAYIISPTTIYNGNGGTTYVDSCFYSDSGIYIVARIRFAKA